jgi:hypothetical protein
LNQGAVDNLADELIGEDGRVHIDNLPTVSQSQPKVENPFANFKVMLYSFPVASFE